MNYVKTTELDLEKTFFHFTRIDNRNSIEQNGLISVAGGENKTGNDSENPTIYFSYGVSGLLKTIDVWIRWEYDKLRWQRNFKISPLKKINQEIMNEVYEKLYEDFKNRNYYSLDLIEGDDPKTSDFSFTGIDKKKEQEYKKFLHLMELYKKEKITFKPHYPGEDMAWMYGPYSNFENGNISQDNWNMNTYIGDRKISPDRIRIIEGENGRTDGLSIALEIYCRYRAQFSDIDLSRLDDFIAYARKRYQSDKDYIQLGTDIGRRCVDSSEEKRYQIINQISTKALVAQVFPELFDVELEDETEQKQYLHQEQLAEKIQSGQNL